MQTAINRKETRQRIRYRIRQKVQGTAARPRLAVFRSQKHIYAQAIDDVAGRTVASSSSLEREIRSKVGRGSGTEAAKQVGESIGKKLTQAGIEAVVFDRGGFVYHGRIKALAEAARSAGLKF